MVPVIAYLQSGSCNFLMCEINNFLPFKTVCELEVISLVPLMNTSNAPAKLSMSSSSLRSRPWKGYAKLKGHGKVITLH